MHFIYSVFKNPILLLLFDYEYQGLHCLEQILDDTKFLLWRCSVCIVIPLSTLIIELQNKKTSTVLDKTVKPHQENKYKRYMTEENRTRAFSHRSLMHSIVSMA